MNAMITTGHNVKQQNGFTLITFDDLAEQARNPKDFTAAAIDADGSLTSSKPGFPWIMPNDCTTGKTLDAIEAHNNFTALIADIDEGNMSLSEIKQRLKDIEIWRYVVYATASAAPGAMRWRVVVPLSHSCERAQWEKLTPGLTQLLGGDVCMDRITQISFLPVLTIINRECYQYAIA